MTIPPIVARVTADTKGLTAGLRDAQTRLATFGKIGAAAAGAVAVGLAALTVRAMANADALAKQARSLGLSVSALQSMSLVAKEAGVEMGQLGTMLQFMQRAVDANTDAFGRMGLSIADLQGLSADEQFARIAEALDGIADPTTRTALAMEVFGRSGRAAINMLSDYRAKAEEARRFQERFGISLSDTAANDIERANDAMGRLGMVAEGLGNRMAAYLAPALERVANGLIAVADAAFGVPTALDRVNATILPIGDALRMTIPALQNFADELRRAGDSGAADEFDALAASLEETIIQFAQGAITADEFQERMAEAKAEADRLVTSLGEVNSAGFSAVIAGLGALWGALNTAANEAARLRGELMDGFEMAPDDGSSIGPGEGTFVSDPNAPKTRPQMPGVNSFPAARGGRGGGGGGGGGLQSQLQARLEALTESLRTEAEIIADWNAESMAILDDALAARMLTEKEYMDARERLEEEHQERLAQIREAGAQTQAQIASGLFGQLADIMKSGGEKTLKLQRTFAVAEALLSARAAAVEAWRKGMQVGGPKVAAAYSALSYARTAAMIAQIMSTGSSGGGVGSARGGASGGEGQTMTQRLLIDVRGNDGARLAAGAIIDHMNRGARQGYRVLPELIGA
jgi:hypothetical protein